MGLNLLESIFGALLSGVIVNSWVYGLVCVLSYQYFRNFPSDGKQTKILVVWMLALQTFNAIIVSKMIYFYLINSFGNYNILSSSNWEFALFHGLSAIAAFFVQVYNAHRIFILTKQYFAVGITVVFAVVSVGFAMAFMAEIYVIVEIPQLHSVSWVAIVWLSASVACDLIITVYQVLYLHKHRTGIDKTNRIINILILYIMSTGLLTRQVEIHEHNAPQYPNQARPSISSISVIVELTTFALFGWNYVHVFISVPLGGVYTMSFLANLDARRRVREIAPGPTTFKVASERSTAPINIQINRTMQVLSDDLSTRGDEKLEDIIHLDHKRSTLSDNVQSSTSENTTLDDNVSDIV